VRAVCNTTAAANTTDGSQQVQALPDDKPSSAPPYDDEEQRMESEAAPVEALLEAKPRTAAPRASRELRDLLPDVWCALRALVELRVMSLRD
jgi:hypothetical protein